MLRPKVFSSPGTCVCVQMRGCAEIQKGVGQSCSSMRTYVHYNEVMIWGSHDLGSLSVSGL